jgi:hypothetical protein
VLGEILGKADLGPGDEGFSLQTPSVALVPLRDAPPGDSYRLRALVRHDARREGSVGVYFGHVPCESAQGRCHRLCVIGFTDGGDNGGRMILELWRAPDTKPDQYAYAKWVQDRRVGPARAAPPGHWRSLVVEVTPEQVRVLLDGQHVRTLSAVEIGFQGVALFQDVLGLDWESVPRGGIGLFVDQKGAATFRNVVIEPLVHRP